MEPQASSAVPADPFRLTLWERTKLLLISLFAIGVAAYLVAAAAMSGLIADLRNTPLDPEGWSVVDFWGRVIRPATLADMLNHKLLFLKLVVPMLLWTFMWSTVVAGAVRGRRTGSVNWILTQLASHRSFRFQLSEAPEHSSSD